jgi:hypothetical protein
MACRNAGQSAMSSYGQSTACRSSRCALFSRSRLCSMSGSLRCTIARQDDRSTAPRSNSSRISVMVKPASWHSRSSATWPRASSV